MCIVKNRLHSSDGGFNNNFLVLGFDGARGELNENKSKTINTIAIEYRDIVILIRKYAHVYFFNKRDMTSYRSYRI